MSDIFKRDLESGRRFSNDAGEAETRDVYAEMMATEKTVAIDNMNQIKEDLTESTANSFKEIQEELMDSLLKMKKFIIEHDLRNADLDKLIGEAEESYKSAGKLIVESIVKG